MMRIEGKKDLPQPPSSCFVVFTEDLVLIGSEQGGASGLSSRCFLYCLLKEKTCASQVKRSPHSVFLLVYYSLNKDPQKKACLPHCTVSMSLGVATFIAVVERDEFLFTAFVS